MSPSYKLHRDDILKRFRVNLRHVILLLLHQNIYNPRAYQSLQSPLFCNKRIILLVASILITKNTLADNSYNNDFNLPSLLLR